MDERQIVTINTMHTCPMTTGNTPHVGGPIIGPGSTGVTLDGIPIALQGDKCVCAAGGQDVILQGCSGVTIDGIPIAVQGSPTAHGGTIPAGVPGAVIISKNTSVLEAGAEGEPAVYNLQWVKEEQIIRNSKIEKVVTLVADARNIPNGEEVTVKVHTPEQDGGSSMLTELKGIVKDNQVQVEWKVEQKEEDENAPKVTDFYLSDDKNKKISKIKYNEEHIFLHINTKNLQGKTFSIKINSPYLEYKHKDTVLNEQILKDYSITSDEEVIELQLNKPFKKGVKKTVSKFTLSIGKIGYEKTLSLKIKRKEKCVVTFSLDETQDNLFGFDSYKVSKKGCKDKEKLKKAYKKLEPFREEYLMPWVSLAQYRYAILKVAVKGKYKEITFNDPQGYFTFEPATITPKTEQVKITCNDTITEKEYKVEVLADGKVAGGLMFVENSVKQIIIRPVFVLESKNDKQKIEFEKEVGKILLKNYLKKAFTPSLIEVDVKEPYKLSLSENDYIHPDKALNYIRGIRACFNIKNGIEIKNPTDDKREELIKNLNQLFILSKIENKIETINEIILFLTNFQCTGDKSAKEVPDSNNGFTYGKSVIMMFLGNENKKPKVEIPHEIMHALGLEHTFDPKETYLFTKGATKNYMDYDNKKKYTFKWQWVKMRESKWITLPLLFLLFVLNACSSYKNINCNYDYSIKEEEKKIDTLSSDFKWDTEKKVNNDVFWYIRPTKYFKGEGISKIIIKDTLGIKLYKGIDYDLQGNIIFSNFTLGTSYIGMEYDYDKEGNIIKETNHNKGWHLCWQQALYLGKKRMRKPNKDKEDLDLRIYKDERKNYKFWVLLYTDKRYKDRAVIIYDQTGKTRKAIKIRNSFIDDQIEDTSSNNNKDSLQ